MQDGGGGAPDLAAGTTVPNIATALECGDGPPVGTGNPMQLARVVVDTTKFPDALCNDGTPAVLYFRPYQGEANRNKWQINLHGGGSCESGASCAARWCSCANKTICPYVEEPTFFNRNTMTNVGPASISGDGLFLRGDAARPNSMGDYNQVELEYCSSDLWSGTSREIVFTAVNPKTNAPVEYSMHVLGAKILDADIATLRQDGVSALVFPYGAGGTLPDLDDADEVVFTGDSAGGIGLVNNLDHLADTLRATNPLVTVVGLMDASTAPDFSRLAYDTHVDPAIRSYDDFLDAYASSPLRRDASCTTWHATNAPGSEKICTDPTHVLRHHVTTPFFVRMALLDQLFVANMIDAGLRIAELPGPLTAVRFAVRLQSELATFGTLSTTAEEGAAFSKNPGVFAPACSKHDTIHSNADTFETTITPSGGAALTLLPVFDNWRNGASPAQVLTQSATAADTSCP